MKTKRVQIDVKDVYQLMLSECRYGYTKNNHLMPGGAYAHAKKYLPKLLKADQEDGLHTAAQLCDECISQQLNGNFYNSLDDEHGSRKEAIEFIDWLLDFIHEKGKDTSYSNFFPYNYDSYLENIERYEALRYRVYELDDFDRLANKIRELTTEPVSKKEADRILFTEELGITSVTMNHIDIKTTYAVSPERVIGELIRIIEPVSYKGKIYSIELAE